MTPPTHRKVLLAALVTALTVLGPAAAAAVDPKAARLYEDALSRFEKQDIKGSIIQLKSALQIDKTMLPVHLLLGRALLADGQPAAAEVAFMEALSRGVSRAEVVISLAQSVVDQGNQPLLLTEPRFDADGLPASLQARLFLIKAAAAADTGDATKALQLISKARVIDPLTPDSWLAEVPVRLRGREFDAARTAVEKALTLAPSSASALYQLSQIEHLRGNLLAALSGYSKALEADANHVEALVARAGLLIDLKRSAEAKIDIARVRSLARIDPRGAYLEALLGEQAGNQGEARIALKQVTALIDPVPIGYIRFRPQLLMLNGLAHYGLGERETAKPYLEAYQKLDPGGGVSKLLAQIYLTDGRIQLAIESLEAYLRAHPGDAQGQALLASAHMSQGRTARATSVAKEALRRQDAPELRTVLGLSMLKAGRTADAQLELEAAYRKDPAQHKAAATLIGLYLHQGANAKALALAEALVKQAPRNPAFLGLLGQAHQAAGNRVAARAAFEAASKQDPILTGPQVQLARLDATAGSFDLAYKRLTDLLSKDERNSELLFELASLADHRKQPDEAMRWLQKAIDHAPPREYRAALAMVELHLRHGRFPKAVEAAMAASAKSPNELAPQLALARAQLANGDNTGARTSLNTATRLASYDAQLQLEIGLLQMLAHNMPGAAYSFDKALSSEPNYLPAQAAMVDVEIRQGQIDKAEERARSIARKHPQRAIGHSLLGDVAWTRGQVPAAVDAYRRAHRTEPSTATLLRLRGAVQRHEGAKAALALTAQWVKSHPNDQTAGALLAGLFASTGDFARARALYESLLKAAPANPDLLNNLANVMLRVDKAQALVLAERALAAAPTNPDIIDTLGWTLLQNGQAERALLMLRDARLRKPSEPTIRYHLAAALAKTGRTDEARGELKAALAGDPAFEGYEDARALLKSIPEQ